MTGGAARHQQHVGGPASAAASAATAARSEQASGGAGRGAGAHQMTPACCRSLLVARARRGRACRRRAARSRPHMLFCRPLRCRILYVRNLPFNISAEEVRWRGPRAGQRRRRRLAAAASRLAAPFPAPACSLSHPPFPRCSCTRCSASTARSGRSGWATARRRAARPTWSMRQVAACAALCCCCHLGRVHACAAGCRSAAAWLRQRGWLAAGATALPCLQCSEVVNYSVPFGYQSAGHFRRKDGGGPPLRLQRAGGDTG